MYNLGYYFTFRLSGPVLRKSDIIMNKAAETEATQVKYHLRTANKGGLQIAIRSRFNQIKVQQLIV